MVSHGLLNAPDEVGDERHASLHAAAAWEGGVGHRAHVVAAQTVVGHAVDAVFHRRSVGQQRPVGAKGARRGEAGIVRHDNLAVERHLQVQLHHRHA